MHLVLRGWGQGMNVNLFFFHTPKKNHNVCLSKVIKNILSLNTEFPTTKKKK